MDQRTKGDAGGLGAMVELEPFGTFVELGMMRFRPLGDSAVLIEVGLVVDEDTARQVESLSAGLQENPLAGVADIVPGLTTIAVHFDPRVVGGALSQAKIEAWIEGSRSGSRPLVRREAREVSVPVQYGGGFGPDLSWVAELAELTETEVIELHASALYTVGAIGFAPGFPYLRGLPARLQVPRRSTPRVAVPAGSVAIAGGQAGIYPQTIPGGWNVIGRTGLRLFDASRRPPAFLQVGDQVRFEPIYEGAAR